MEKKDTSYTVNGNVNWYSHNGNNWRFLKKLQSCHIIQQSYSWLLLLPSIFPSIRVFSNESVLCIRWPKYWSFSFRISPSNEYWGLISFRINWFDLLAVQGTLKSLLQHHSSLLVCCYLLLWLKRLKKIHPYCYAVWKGNIFCFKVIFI